MVMSMQSRECLLSPFSERSQSFSTEVYLFTIPKKKKRAIFHFLEKMRLCSGQPPCVCHVPGAEWMNGSRITCGPRRCDSVI